MPLYLPQRAGPSASNADSADFHFATLGKRCGASCESVVVGESGLDAVSAAALPVINQLLSGGITVPDMTLTVHVPVVGHVDAKRGSAHEAIVAFAVGRVSGSFISVSARSWPWPTLEGGWGVESPTTSARGVYHTDCREDKAFRRKWIGEMSRKNIWTQ